MAKQNRKQLWLDQWGGNVFTIRIRVSDVKNMVVLDIPRKPGDVFDVDGWTLGFLPKQWYHIETMSQSGNK